MMLTVFTPTYNRAYCIEKCYESLCAQTCKNFLWLVIDDGSTDNTKHLIDKWIAEAKIQIKYFYQQNQGMHGAHNAAYRLIDTELNVCIDSDDYMPSNAVEKIIDFWKQTGNDKYAGIIGLDENTNGSIIGKTFPSNLRETTLSEYYEKLGGSGDKKLVYRTEIVKKYPEYPIFEGEKYVGLGYKYLLIDNDYKMLTLNAPLVVVNYQPDGSSLNMYRQYWQNPRGCAFMRKVDMQYSFTFKRKFKSAIHYVSSSIVCKNTKFLSESPCKFLTILAIPFGCILYFFIRHKVRKNKLMKL